MALRRINDLADPPTTNNYPTCYVEVLSKNPFKSIDGQPYCIWQYRITVTPRTGGVRNLREGEVGVYGPPSARVGLAFSARVDIKRPELYPECAEAQGTSILQIPAESKQYVFKNIQVQSVTSAGIDITFIAPCEEDLFTPVRVVGAQANGTGWIEVPFQVSAQSIPCITQTIRGPAIVKCACAVAPSSASAVSTETNSSPSQAGSPATGASPLDSSARELLKGTLVPLKLSSSPGDTQGLVKHSVVRQLALSQGETDSVETHLASQPLSHNRTAQPVAPRTLNLFRSFERAVIPSLRPNVSAVAAIPVDELSTFANAVVETRAARIRAVQETQLPEEALGAMLRSLHSAVIASRSLEVNTAIQPLGMLNLERIEMVPAGLQRGELIATIPLAPGEETAVTHKEWSVTSKEFTTIVTDSLEQTSETGVTDNTDLSQSTTSQNQHSTQFNITGTVQGGIPMISGSTSAGVTAQDAGSKSATDSIKHATATTQKAAARSRQEHKTTISTTTVTGTSETSTRILKNSSATDPIRIDYFSLMRKWRVRLYRFGLRLTYDVVVPEPAAAMRRAYMELETLRNQIGPFAFDVKYSDITTDFVDKNGNPTASRVPPNQPKYLWLADRHGAVVKPYPSDPAPIFRSIRGPGNRDWSYLDLEFNVPTEARIEELCLSAMVGNNDKWPYLRVIGAREEAKWEDKDGLNFTDETVYAKDGRKFMQGATGDQKLTFWLWYSSDPSISLKVLLTSATDVIDQWRADVWNALYNAAQTNYYANQQAIAARISAIEDRLANVDTLTLRREESDEVMKTVLKFALGTDFDFMPDQVYKAFKAGKGDLSHGIAFDGPKLDISKDQWTVVQRNEDVVRFINQAIEWENVVTFLYSYFWDVPESWFFIKDLRHSDLTRQAFLRAGQRSSSAHDPKGLGIKMDALYAGWLHRF
jgi:hypothetical protein